MDDLKTPTQQDILKCFFITFQMLGYDQYIEGEVMNTKRILVVAAALFLGSLITSCNFHGEGVTSPPAKQFVAPARSSGSTPAIGCWDFDENEGEFAGDGCNGHSGTLTGARWVPGVCGSALEFDGSDEDQQYVAMDGGDWLTQPVGTIEAWIMIDPDETAARIISTEAAGWHNGLHIGYNTETSNNLPINGGIIAGIHSTEGGGHYAETYIDDVSKGEWHYVAFVWDGEANTISLYVDGAMNTETSPHPGIVDTGEPMTVGCWQNEGYGIGRGAWFKGSVDELRFYDKALSIEELDSHYSTGCFDVVLDIKPGSCPNPLNPKSKGRLPVALLGSADLDVRDIDISSILLEGVAPVQFSIEDVSGPAPDHGDDGCNGGDSDGYDDLVLKFLTQEVSAALREFMPGDVLTLELTGMMSSGSLFSAEDVVTIVGKPTNWGQGEVLLTDCFDGPLDGGQWIVGSNSSGGEVYVDGTGTLLINSGHQFGGGTWVGSKEEFSTGKKMSLNVTCRAEYPDVGDDDDAFWGFFRQDQTGISFIAFRVIGGPDGPVFLAKVRNDDISKEFVIESADWQTMSDYRIDVGGGTANFFVNGSRVCSFNGPEVPQVDSEVRFDKTSPGQDRFLFVDCMSLTGAAVSRDIAVGEVRGF